MENFHFETLADLRDFLNRFTEDNLESAYPREADYIVLTWRPETLSDGSEIVNVDITTKEDTR